MFSCFIAYIFLYLRTSTMVRHAFRTVRFRLERKRDTDAGSYH